VSSQFALILIASVLFCCTFALRLVPEAPRVAPDKKAAATGPSWAARLVEVFKEVWAMLRTRRGLVAIALVFLPIGSAAAQGIFSGQIATDWGASAGLIATTSGFAAGIAATVGCLFGGWMSDALGRRNAYMLAGVVLAAIAVGMAVSPKNPTSYAIFTLAYQLGGGIAYGTFTGFVLEVIGTGAAATKYNALASLSNIPILYMTKLDGWASTEHGPVTMLFVDAGSEIVGVVAFILVVLALRPDREPVRGTTAPTP
jgi:Na+/melibiose symporter-like transporter